MTDPIREELRGLLTERAREVDVPEPPLTHLMAAGARAERRRGRIMLGSVAAAVVLAIATGAAVTNWPGRTTAPPTPSQEPTEGPTSHEISSLADLPQGEPSRIPFVSGRTVHLPDRDVPLPRKAGRSVVTADDVLVTYDDGSLHHIDVSTGRLSTVTDNVATFALAGTHVVAYSQNTRDTPVVVVRDLVNGDTFEQEIPAIPSCCDNPFQIAGADQSMVIAGTPAAGQWVWAYNTDTRPAPPPQRIRGLGERTIMALAPMSLVVAVGPQGHDLGRIEGDRFVGIARVDSVSADFSMPGTVVYSDTDGHLFARPLDAAPNGSEVVGLQLPTGMGFPTMHAEDATHVVFFDAWYEFDQPDDEVQIRCDVRTGICEIAGWFDPDAGRPPPSSNSTKPESSSND